MMSKYSDNLWAEGLGIDLDELQTERFDHPNQLANHRRITRQAAEYWARERFLARLGDGVAVETPAPTPQAKPKRAKVRRYEFTERQLEIALRSLNAGGGV
jgi:hypothetical protein